jgi:hypothetical protein
MSDLHISWIECGLFISAGLFVIFIVCGIAGFLAGLMRADSQRARDALIWQFVLLLATPVCLFTTRWILPFNQWVVCIVPLLILVVCISLLLERRRKSSAQQTSPGDSLKAPPDK